MALPALTLLSIAPISGQDSFYLTPYSVRGITETISRAPSEGVVRSVNGTLLDWTEDQFRKYSIQISCKDQMTPALDMAWIGQIVEVHCASEFSYATGGTPQRPAVSGSERVEGDFTFYRPIIMARIMDVKNSRSEWAAEYAWSVQLLEV